MLQSAGSARQTASSEELVSKVNATIRQFFGTVDASTTTEAIPKPFVVRQLGDQGVE